MMATTTTRQAACGHPGVEVWNNQCDDEDVEESESISAFTPPMVTTVDASPLIYIIGTVEDDTLIIKAFRCSSRSICGPAETIGGVRYVKGFFKNRFSVVRVYDLDVRGSTSGPAGTRTRTSFSRRPAPGLPLHRSKRAKVERIGS